MTRFNTSFKKLCAAAAVAATVAVSAPASADTIQLGFILDRSGSIGAGNWTTIVNGLASAVNTFIPVGGTDTYEVSVVTFGSTATIDIANFIVNNASDRSTLATNIAAIGFTGGSTNFADAFAKMQDALDNTILGANTRSYVNFATDGIPNDNTAGIAARNALLTAGVDNLSIEGIGGGVNAAVLQSDYCFPGPCDTTAPYNFPTQGFYIGVADAAAYTAAIGVKLQTVTGNTVPEPGSLALLGIALAGLGFSRRKPA